ncbi:helix-turn-helix domain-containing protein [Rhodobacterales bacterium HKCCE4037]|nr:helix-turn-helix domain-containing protein [Rhodobacterales bacterium HKCCE4037]
MQHVILPDDVDPETAAEEERVCVAAAFAALGSEARLGIVLRLVRAGPAGMATGDLGEAVGIAGSVLTHHLKQLTAAGLVYQRKDGRRILSFVDHEFIENLSHFLLAECCADMNALKGHRHG